MHALGGYTRWLSEFFDAGLHADLFPQVAVQLHIQRGELA